MFDIRIYQKTSTFYILYNVNYFLFAIGTYLSLRSEFDGWSYQQNKPTSLLVWRWLYGGLPVPHDMQMFDILAQLDNWILILCDLLFLFKIVFQY